MPGARLARRRRRALPSSSHRAQVWDFGRCDFFSFFFFFFLFFFFFFFLFLFFFFFFFFFLFLFFFLFFSFRLSPPLVIASKLTFFLPSPFSLHSSLHLSHQGHIHHVQNTRALGERVPLRLASNLFFASAGAHPGGSVTGAPGHNAAAALLLMLSSSSSSSGAGKKKRRVEEVLSWPTIRGSSGGGGDKGGASSSASASLWKEFARNGGGGGM